MARKESYHITDKRIRSAVAKSLGVPATALTPLELRILRLAMKRGYQTDLASRLKKLGEEIGELAEAIANGDKVGIRKESADCGIVLSHIGIIDGFSLHLAMVEKLTEVEHRHFFTNVGPDGYYQCQRCRKITHNLAAHKNEQCPEAK